MKEANSFIQILPNSSQTKVNISSAIFYGEKNYLEDWNLFLHKKITSKFILLILTKIITFLFSEKHFSQLYHWKGWGSDSYREIS